MFKGPSLQPPYSAPLPCPPAVRLMSWLRRGLMGMRSCHQRRLGTAAGPAEKLQRESLPGAGSSHGDWRRVEPLTTAPEGSTGPHPLAWAPSNHSHPGQKQCILPSSVPWPGPAYLGAGQQPHSTGRRWKRSRSAGAAPRGAGQPRPDCWLGGGHLGRGKGQTGRGGQGRYT